MILCIPLGRLSLGSLRGGGSVGLFEMSDDIMTTMWRGRWGDQKTLHHYLQTGLADFLESELPPGARNVIYLL